MAIHLKNRIQSYKEALSFYIKNIYRHLFEDEILFLASGISFNGVLCLIPILLLFTSVFGIILNSSDLAVQKIQEILSAAFPNQPYAQNIKNSIQQIIKDIIENRKSFGLFGLGVLMWTATSLFSSVRTALNRVFRIKSSKLVLLTILEDVVWVIIVGALFVFIIIITWLYTLVENLMHILPGFASVEFVFFEQTLPFIVSSVLTLIMFFIVYRFIPDKSISWKPALLSAVTAAFLWISAGKLFAWYLSTFNSFSNLYGTYAFLLVLLVWVYYSSIVFIFGAIIGEIYRERSR